jgi:hypothetical protein
MTPKHQAAERASEIAPGVYCNPGAGAVPSGTLAADAEINMHALISDVGLDGATFEGGKPDETGRYTFTVSYAGRVAEVDMPGVTLEEVRYMRLPDQNIWHYPRLYVGGSSWVWAFAVDTLREHLTGKGDE